MFKCSIKSYACGVDGGSSKSVGVTTIRFADTNSAAGIGSTEAHNYESSDPVNSN
jgi:hypothetical protein